MNHKRKGPKSTRSVDSPRINEQRARIGETEQIDAVEADPCPWDTDETSEARLCEGESPYPSKARRRDRAALWYFG